MGNESEKAESEDLRVCVRKWGVSVYTDSVSERVRPLGCDCGRKWGVSVGES